MENIYLPHLAVIHKIYQETKDVKTILLKFRDPAYAEEFHYQPGQFIEVSVFGVGEAPISITSSPHQRENLEISVKSVGAVSRAIHKLKVGDEVGVRGPLGNGFPYQSYPGQNLLIIGGGIGLATLRSLINYLSHVPHTFSRIAVCYGARTQEDMVYKRDLHRWLEQKDMDIYLTVDHPTSGWVGEVGVVSSLLPKTGLSGRDSIVIMCGPPMMMRFTIQELLRRQFDPAHIFLSMERYIKCGVGKCGHCNIGRKYVCVDGPVFSYQKLLSLEANPF